MTQQPSHAIPAWTLGDRLRKARTHAGMEQDELADTIGVSRSSVYNYEGEKTRPRMIVLRAWAMATGVPLDWLVGSDGPFEGARSRSGAGLPHVDSNHEPAGKWFVTSASPLAA